MVSMSLNALGNFGRGRQGQSSAGRTSFFFEGRLAVERGRDGGSGRASKRGRRCLRPSWQVNEGNLISYKTAQPTTRWT